MFNKIISNSKNILIIILLIIICILLFKHNSIEKELKYNQVILTDSLYEYKNKIGELYKEKELYITNSKELEKINKELHNEIKNLKDNPIIITKTETIIKFDSIYIESKTNLDSLTNDKINNYNFKNDYLTMNITHKLSKNNGSLFIDNINMNADLTYSIIENKKSNKLSIIAKSNNPYLTINSIDGGFIDLDDSKVLKRYYNKKNKWALSINGGYGIVYDTSNKNFVLGPTLSIGVSRTIVQW